MKVAVYTITQNKFDLARKSFRCLRKCAGIHFDHFVWDQNSQPEMRAWLAGLRERDTIKWLRLSERNVGQNIAANFMLDAMNNEYDWILRWDPDALTWDRRFLKKLIDVSQKVIDSGEIAILSPEITKLKEPPPSLLEVDFKEVGELQVVPMLGGICRLHPGPFFEHFRFNQFMPMGLGEAAEVADEVSQLARNGARFGMLRYPGVKVEHAYGHDGQAEAYPEEFGFMRELNRHVGYGL